MPSDQQADGPASSRRLRKRAAACWGRRHPERTFARVELLATGTGQAVRTAAVPAHVDLGSHGAQRQPGGRAPVHDGSASAL